MTKDKKGITLISLAVTLIVMLIILGVTLVSGNALLDNSRLTKIETTLYTIKARAETLIEQYDFDGNLRSIIGFSELERGNGRPTVYAYNSDLSNLKYQFNNGFMWANSSDDSFIGKVNTIYSSSSISSYLNSSNNVKVNTGSGEITINRVLFVKWGLKECISQGVINKDHNPNQSINGEEFKSDIIDNTKKYAIVAYDLQNGSVLSVSYSLGHRNEENVIEYTLEDMLDVEEE